MGFATTQVKDAALRSLLKRRRENNRRKLENNIIQTDSPVCVSCDDVVAQLPKPPTSVEHILCGECNAMWESGWLSYLKHLK